MKTLADALRCTTLPASECKCEGCQYRNLEQISPEFPVRPAVTIDGIDYWESCDWERITIEAAEFIEKRTGVCND